MSVHIPNNELYESTLDTLNKVNVDFTKVAEVNKMIQTGDVTIRKRNIHFFGFLKPIIILNSIIPWLLWKYVEKKNDEIEFVDTFRFGINTLSFGLFYILQTLFVEYFFGWKIGVIYFLSSLLLVLFFSKTYTTPAESPLE